MTEREVFFNLCLKAGSPFALSLWLRFKYDESLYLERTINPDDYSDAAVFAKDYACLVFLKKFRGLRTGIDLSAAAILKFGYSEEKCRLTNESLRYSRTTTGRLARTDTRVLLRAQELMSRIWGDPSFDDLFRHRGWGPGATASLKGARATREDKMSQLPVSITPSAIPYFRQVIKYDYSWLSHLLKQDICGPVSLLDTAFASTEVSRVLTVPKDARSDRTIAAEPTANIYLQKGIGGYIRSRLRRYGIDLDNQSLNQTLASTAQINGLATLDLSAASDTISIEAVKLLCPPEMFDLLNRLRTPSYRVRDDVIRFHKFSSMGNGFTFELESMIFFSVVKAVEDIFGSGKPLGVFGDDLIVGADIVDHVVLALEDLGFSLNLEKSFVKGKFYESCGKHYFDTVDVTPPYQKEIVDSALEHIRMTNRVFDWIQRDEFDILGLRRTFGSLHASLLRNRPSSIKSFNLFGPYWVTGDGFYRVFNHDNLYDLRRNAYKINFLDPLPSRKRSADGGLYADCLRISAGSLGGNSLPTYGFVDIRPKGRQHRYKRKTRWVSLLAKLNG